MNIALKDLSRYSRTDKEKQKMISDVLSGPYDILPVNNLYNDKPLFKRAGNVEFYTGDNRIIERKLCESDFTKHCPKCGANYPDSENVCPYCLVRLKKVSGDTDVYGIVFEPHIDFEGANVFEGFDDMLSAENLSRIRDFDFSYADVEKVIRNIKFQAFRNFDEIVKTNAIEFDELPILDRILLFAKSFVNVEYKSYGGQLGYFEKNTIYVDDRQTKTLQITTLIHELSHFLIKEILAGMLCIALDASKNEFVESLATYILDYDFFTRLIDEYAAHNVEGRFTLFGYQDCSSFRQIEIALKGEMDENDVEITKSIGNNFAIEIKNILESFIDRDMREDIKDQFMRDVLDDPDYKALAMENCKILTRKSFSKAIWLILNEGCLAACENTEQLSLK